MPVMTVFSLERLSWLADGKRQTCGAFEIRGLPTEAAKIALNRGRTAIATDRCAPRPSGPVGRT
jgi:hypothetical protein